MTDVLITARQLAAALESDRPPVVLDVRWRLERPDGWPVYFAGHIPGAVYVDLEQELAAPNRPASEGRHPLPDVERLQESARRWGISNDSWVVVYDDAKGMSAARAWWLLRYAGLEDVRMLDGALPAWESAGLPLQPGPVEAKPGDVTLRYGALPVLDIDGAAEFPSKGVLLDARARDRFRGDHEPVDPVPGHIPGAVSAPTTENLAPDGTFLPADELRRRFEELGVRDAVAVYCGSGVTAAHEAAALTIAGFEPALYPGSWSEWANNPGRPVETGE